MKKVYWTQNVCFIFPYICSKQFSQKHKPGKTCSKLAQTHVDHHIQCSLFLSDLNQKRTYTKILVKLPNVKIHKNPFCISQVDRCGHTDGQPWPLTDESLKPFIVNETGTCKKSFPRLHTYYISFKN